MSDTIEYTERSPEEVAALEQQFRGSGYTGQAYVAPPAPGHDTKGLWHYFPAHGRTGYSTHAIAMHRMMLDELHIPTSLIPHRLASLDIDQFPKDRAEMLTKWMADAVGLAEVMIVSLPPDLGMYNMTRALVNYVAGPECTKAAKYAVDMVNSEHLTALWCVSPFAARAYEDGGADRSKVYVVRPPICDGVWRDMFTPIDELVTGPVKHEGPYVFGTLGTWHERKGFHDLVRAYFGAFQRSQEVELHIRTSSMDDKLTIKKFEEKVIAEIAEIAKEFGDDNFPASKRQPRIKLLTGSALTEQEIITWLGSIDCFVNPSYAEGLGIPQMWAMAQGVPLITTDFGAVGEFVIGLREAGHMPVPPVPAILTPVPTSMRSHSPIWAEGSMWGGYDVGDFSTTMRHMFDVGPIRLHAVAGRVREHFSFAACRTGAEKALWAVCRPEVLKEWGL